MKVEFDIVVIGGGHAGIEAAAAAARLGMNVGLITMDAHAIGKMSCNPAIGGLAKGHLVKEIDALGGVMGQLIDQTGIHFKILNRSKGPAVWSPRAQADRNEYTRYASEVLAAYPNVRVVEAAVKSLIIKKDRLCGVIVNDGSEIKTRAAILTAGTFLNGKIFIGMQHMSAGRAGEKPATGITEQLQSYGFQAGRLKTGTPPRIHRDSIDYNRLEEQTPDDPPVPFSYRTTRIERKQVNCYITYTHAGTHDILRTGFNESPMYAGVIEGVGPRYCPSIEDKIVRFADKERHQIFLEPEGYDNPEVYVNGFSTSLPEHAQVKGLHSIPGLENARIIRLGYAIEYDYFPTWQLYYTLETKAIKNLYFAGQINGTSGYEEAAAQGLIAGTNAALKLQDRGSFSLSRSDAYMGVMIDDLINKETLEPYRLFTSRAEFRLLLRADNADLRLMEKGIAIGLVKEEALEYLQRKKRQIADLTDKIDTARISREQFRKLSNPTGEIKQTIPLKEALRRPELTMDAIKTEFGLKHYESSVLTDVAFTIKFEGYIRRQMEMVEKFKRMESKEIPANLDYDTIPSLSNEAREKLKSIQPHSLGQASRIQGVRQSDLTVLLIYLEKYGYKKQDVSRETEN